MRPAAEDEAHAAIPAPVPAASPGAPASPPGPARFVPDPVFVPGAAVAPPAAAADAAMLAYRAAIAAYDAHDAGAYFGAFVDPLECFHGAPAHPVAALRASRADVLTSTGGASGGLFVASLTVARASDDEVVLVDRGAYWSWRTEGGGTPGGHAYMTMSSDAIEQGVHEKVVVMRLVGGRWLIAAETDRRHLDCIAPPVTLDAMPAALAACRAASEACLRGCDETCEACEGGCNGCNLCPDGCARALGECVGAGADFTPFVE